jgi:hypothetical protein
MVKKKNIQGSHLVEKILQDDQMTYDEKEDRIFKNSNPKLVFLPKKKFI